MSKKHLQYGSLNALCGNVTFVDVKTFVNLPRRDLCDRCCYLLVRHGYSLIGLKQRFRAANIYHSIIGGRHD